MATIYRRTSHRPLILHCQFVHVSLFRARLKTRFSLCHNPIVTLKEENKSRGNEPSFNWRGVVLIAIGFRVIGLAMLFSAAAHTANLEDVPYNRFLELLENKQIVNDKNYPLSSSSRMAGRRKPCAAITFKPGRRANRPPSRFRFARRST